MGDSTDTFSATARYVRITVTGSSGGWASFYECSIYGLPGVLPTPPNPPAGLTATTVSTSQINLGWTAGGGAASYNVKRATVSGGPYTSIATGITTLSYSNTGLNPGTTYYYVVSAVNGAGESTNSSQADAITIPAAPTGLTATAGNAQAILNWTATAGAASYNVKRATVTGGPYISVAAGVTALTYTDTGQTNGTPYYYVISAINASGESANSAQAGTTPAFVPILLSQGQPVTASSYQSGHDPVAGNDGSGSTRWTASGSSYPQWWRVDLGSVWTISGVTIIWENSANWSYKYRIEVSNNDTDYSTVVDQTTRTAIGDTTDNFNAAARYVRVTVTGSSGGWASLYELQVGGS